jgi:hypothetical protein
MPTSAIPGVMSIPRKLAGGGHNVTIEAIDTLALIGVGNGIVKLRQLRQERQLQ